MARFEDAPLSLNPTPDAEAEVNEGSSAYHRHGRPAQIAAVSLTIVALLPVLVVVATRTGHRYLPVQDLAYIDLRVRDVWSRNIPLVGAYSREFNHPGPLFFWLIGVPARLFGSPAWATLVGAAVLQGVAIAGCARLAWRRGGLPTLALVLLALLLSYPGPWMFVQPWNPNIAFPFLALYLLLIWSVSLGERDKLVWAAVVGTFLVQTHIGYVLLVLVPAAWLAWSLARGTGAAATLRAWRRPLRNSALVGSALWAPVIIEQAVHPSQGNVKSILKYFAKSDQSVAGIRTALGLWATEWRLPPPWLGGGEPTRALTAEVRPSSLAWLVVPIVLVVAAVWIGRRARNASDNRLLAVMVVASVAGIAAMAALRGPTEPYLFMWRRLLATLFLASVLMVIWRAALRDRVRVPHSRQVVTVVVALLLVAEAASTALQVSRLDRGRVQLFEPTARRVLAQVERRPLPTKPVLFRGVGLGGLVEGIMDELDRRGVPVRVEKGLGFKWGESRTATSAQVASVWYVLEWGYLVSDLTGRRSARVLARVTPLPRNEERELVDLQRRLSTQLRDAGRPDLVGYLDEPLFAFLVDHVRGIDRQAVDRVSALDDKVRRSNVCRCAVVSFPASAANELNREVKLSREPLPAR